MALCLRKVQRTNPQDRSKSKWYLTQEKSGSVGIKQIAKEIENKSALSLGDVQNVLSNLVNALPLFLKLGQSVSLEGFGTFRLTVSSDGADKPEELDARHVKAVKIVFLPSTALKRSLQDIVFEVSSGAPGAPSK
jgi:predicted histone-like DNA-binding protein